MSITKGYLGLYILYMFRCIHVQFICHWCFCMYKFHMFLQFWLSTIKLTKHYAPMYMLIFYMNGDSSFILCFIFTFITFDFMLISSYQWLQSSIIFPINLSWNISTRLKFSMKLKIKNFLKANLQIPHNNQYIEYWEYCYYSSSSSYSVTFFPLHLVQAEACTKWNGGCV